MRSRTRLAVQSPLLKPHASGPRLSALELSQLGRAELGWSASALSLAQATPARLFQFAGPAADRLSMHADLARDLGLAESCSEQSRRLHSPRFQRGEVPPHTRWITHALYISKYQTSRRYLAQDLIVTCLGRRFARRTPMTGAYSPDRARLPPRCRRKFGAKVRGRNGFLERVIGFEPTTLCLAIVTSRFY